MLPETSVSEVKTISPSEIHAGQSADITGTNLEDVLGAYLTKGQIDTRIFLLPISETRLTVSIPQGIDPETYNLELKIEGKDSRLTAGELEVISGRIQSRDAREQPPIIFANLNWDSVRMQNAIARFIVENGYGYTTDTIPDLPGHAEDVFKSLVNGSIQVDMEVWLPNLRKEWEKALESGAVIPLGKSLDVTWQSGFVVPTYTIKGDPTTGNTLAPGLRTVHDLKNYTEVFAKPGSGGKAVLWNCPPFWNCSKINEGQVRAYGLDDVIELRNPGTEEEFFNKLLLATEGKTAWLGYMWSPTKAASTLDLTRLVEPNCDVGQNPEDGCGYDDTRVRIAVHPSLVANAANLVEMFRKWDFKASTLFVAEDCLKQMEKDFEKAAVCYLKKEQAVWSQWATIDATQRVREALRRQ